MYKAFARMLYNRLSPKLFRSQSWDQHAFTPGIRIEDALLCAEASIEYSLEYQVPLWMLSMDLRKAFDTIDHHALLHSLRLHGIDEGYCTLLHLLYGGQYGSVHGSSSFSVLRGVKQGDVLSAILFNCPFDLTFDKWKRRLSHEGLYVGYSLERLTNTRYADDVLLYAKSLSEL